MAEAKFEYQPLPIFTSFHMSAARTRVLFGGYGSGKSHALCAEAIALGLEQPGSEFLVMRKTVPALKITTERIFVSLLPADFLKQCKVGRAGGHLDFIQFPNGSLYWFRGCDDWRKHRSLNLAYIVWDEADEFEADDFDGLQSRVRQTSPTPAARALGHTTIERRGNILATNPRGHNWLYQYAVDPKTRKEGWEHWVSSSLDNPYLPLDTINDWLGMPDPWVRRYVLCSFDEFAGAVYPDWSWDTHVIEPLKGKYDPQGWFVMGFDPGTSSGNAALWCYYDKSKHRFVAVAEYNETGLAVPIHAAAWRRIEAAHRMRVRRRIADPKPINVRDRGSNVRLSDQYARLGYRFELGPNSIDDRVTALGTLIAQRRFVCTNDCPRLYEQILNYRWADLTPAQIERGKEAQPVKKDVDLVDAAQYAVSRYVAPPKVKPAMTDREQMTAEIHAAIRRQIRNKSSSATRGHDLGSVPV